MRDRDPRLPAGTREDACHGCAPPCVAELVVLVAPWNELLLGVRCSVPSSRPDSLWCAWVYSQAAELRRRLQEAEAVAAERGEVVAALEGRLEAGTGPVLARYSMPQHGTEHSLHLILSYETGAIPGLQKS